MRAFFLLPLLACSASAAPVVSASQAGSGFWEHWGDGKGELAGYAVVQPRYGELHEGQAVLVFVTETLNSKSLIKADDPGRADLPVLKLNTALDFKTGVYDYNVMTSTFVPLDGSQGRGSVSKMSFSSQEWCGHVYDQVKVRDGSMTHTWHSYFESEGEGEGVSDVPAGAVYVDAMPILSRDLAGPLVAPGQARDVPVWPRAQHSRFRHVEPTWRPGRLSREASTKTITVPAGDFEVRRTTLEVDGLTGSWDVEVAAPHRLVAWSWSDGERGELVGVERQAYWNFNGPNSGALRKTLGLEP
ncbi:MAG: hypothetical protein AB8H79_14555 [Myxococcota bacterium]